MSDARPFDEATDAPRPDAGRRRLALLLDQAQRLMAEREPLALLHRVCAAARELTGATIAGVVVLQEDGTLEQMVSLGLDEATSRAMSRLLEIGQDHPARPVFERREVVVGSNPGGDPTAICLPATHPPVHAYAFVPVASPARVYGWLAIVEKAGGAVFSDEDVRLATTFGALVGVAFENARLVERLRSQARELREHEEQTDFAMSVAGVGVAYRDLETTQVVLSRSLADMFGLPAGVREVPEESIYAIMHPEDAPAVRAAVEKAIQERGEFVIDFRVRLPAAGVRWLQFRGRITTDAEGRAARKVGVMTDVTGRRMLEHELRQAQKMEALGQLAGGVAHDFNNLLTAIIGYGRFALESAGQAAQRREIEEIVKAAGRAATLSKQLLAFSRRHVVERTVVDVNLAIVDMVSMLRRVIGEDVELSTTLTPEVAHVRIDRSQLEQAVMNLVINARDAAGPGGRIRIETAVADLDAAAAAGITGLAPGAYVTLAVTDDGAGMTEAVKARLFEPFFTTKPRGQGTGLGLATVYGSVVQGHGAVHVESEVGLGSTFTIYLPRVSEPAAPGVPPEIEVASASSTVLLVEDEQAVRELVRIILERAGHTVIEAATPEDAASLFEGMETVDLLLTDVVMPGMSGFDLFRQLSSRRPSLRVLFMSGYSDYAQFDPAIAERGAAFIEKPFSAEALVAKVRDALQR